MSYMPCAGRPERERDYNACKLCLVSYLNDFENGMQAVADDICYALADVRERDYNACILCLVSHLDEFENGMQAVADHICYVLANLHTCACHMSINVRMVSRRWQVTYAMCWQA